MAVGEKALQQGIGKRLPMSGGEMTGFLLLHDDPVEDLHAVPKRYVDDGDALVLAALDDYLLKTGGTLTGFLTLHADPTAALHAVTKQYLDNALAGVGSGSDPTLRRLMMTQKARLNGTEVTSYGMAVPLIGTAVAASVVDADGAWIRYSQSTAGAGAGWAGVATNQDTQTRHNPKGYVRVKTTSWAGSQPIARCWVGLFSSSPIASDAPSAGICGFRFAKGTDTNWRAYTSDGSSATNVDTGVAIANDTPYKLGLEITTTECKFYIDDALVATITTTLPSPIFNLAILAQATRAAGIGDDMLLIDRAVFTST
jgi:hypothetical protein